MREICSSGNRVFFFEGEGGGGGGEIVLFRLVKLNDFWFELSTGSRTQESTSP